MRRMMIDIETLDTKPSAVVLSVGLVVFGLDVDGEYMEYETCYRNLVLKSQMDKGRTISESTLMWWMKQTPEARGAAFMELGRISTEEWVDELGAMYGGCEEVWSHGAGFDITIMESLLEGHVPWGYSEARDTRTLSAITGIPVSKPTEEHAHHALSDAVAQAQWVAQAMRSL